jgi:hypothetical protein
MKRIAGLYEQIISVENLRLADEKARRGKTHTYGVMVHDRHREEDIQALHEAFTGYIRPKLAELLLTVKDNWQIFPIAENRYDKGGRALDYVGYKFYRKQKLIRKSIKKNFCRAAARLNRRRPTLPVKAYKQEVAPWLGWAQHSNSKHLLQTIIKKDYYVSIL